MLLLGIFAACGTKEEESESLKESETEIGEMTETILERTKDLSYLNLQSYRPRLHYSQEANAMNDPNGLWYDEVAKVYHLNCP